MFKPEIYAKGSLTHEQLSAKDKLGHDGLEIQLLGELIKDRVSHQYNSVDDVFSLSEFEAYNIKVIHTPLVPGVGDVILEAIVDSEDVRLLTKVFKIANYFGEKKGMRIPIVIHSESFYDKLSDLGNSWKNIVEEIDRLLQRFPYTELLIENVSPIRGIGKGKTLHLSNNFGFDNIEMVKILRETLDTDRIGTCLDTCHAMLTKKYMDTIYKEVGDILPEDFSMDRFFRNNKEYCKLVHLAHIKGSGYGKGRHGIPFRECDYPLLKSILDIYEEYDYECPITLEVEETDYSVCDGYRDTKALVDRYYSELSE